MFEFEHKLRHLPFFQEIASHHDGEPGWHAATAGLVVLRLVDARIEDGVSHSDDWVIRSVRGAVEQLESQNRLRTMLSGVLETVISSAVVDMGTLAPRLMAYGQFLEYEGKWALASDVYESIVAHTHPLQEADVATQAHLRRGYCLRQLGNLTDSVRAYRTAGEIAQVANDLVGVLRSRIGEAKAAVSRGNMPHAQAILEDTIHQADRHQLAEVKSMALHDRAMVAHLSGEYELAVTFAYEALEITQSPRERDRILGDIATSFYKLGVRTAARDAYLILAATAQEQYARWFATLNLMEIAVDEGEQMLFEQYRRSLQPSALPPRLRVQYWMAAGVGYDRLGQADEARVFLERALTIAEEHELNQLSFEVEAALRLCGREQDRRVAPTHVEVHGEALEHIIQALQSRREEIGV